jgi:glycosyltransferase involved in cell wall biosynthesis
MTTRQRRVSLVSEHASPLASLGGADAGGQNVHVASLASELGRQGCAVTVFTRRDAVELPARMTLAPNVELRHVHAGPARPIPKDDLLDHMPAFAHRLRRRWLVDQPDIVHAHFWMSGWAAMLAAAGVPTVQTFHALGAVKRRHQASADTSPPERQAIETQLLGTVDRVIATCSDEVRELVAMGGDPDRISVVPCGIDPGMFRPDGPVAALGTAPRRLLVLSRLVPRKGVDDVIRALVRLPSVELVVAGGPADRDLDRDPEVRRLRDVARAHGVGDRVRFVGSVPRPEVPDLIRSADVVVSAPWYEPFGIVPVEAMACGRPVVGTAVGGLLDTVVPGRTGLLVPPRDPMALAEAIGQLLANPSLRARMGDEAVARVRQHFTWDQVARATLDVYDAVGAAAARAVGAAAGGGVARGVASAGGAVGAAVGGGVAGAGSAPGARAVPA